MVHTIPGARSEADLPKMIALSVSGCLTVLLWFDPRSKRAVVPPPGLRLCALADLLCSPKTCDRILKPILADMQAEVFEALAQGRRFKAMIARIRGCLAFWKAAGLHTVLKTVGEVVRAVKGAKG
jgi:hypothetical protein